MNPAPVAILAPLVASLAGWMLSGSPVPMALSLIVLLVSTAGGAILARGSNKVRKYGRSLAPVLIAGLAYFLEIRLYSSGQALAIRAELPPFFHLGLALLWWVAADLFVRLPQLTSSRSNRQGITGIVGGLILFAASTAAERYDFGAWEIYPIAAFPAVSFIALFLLPALPLIKNLLFVVVPATLAATALVLGSTTAGDNLRPWLFPNEFEISDTSRLRPDAPGGSRNLIDGASRHLPREADIRFTRQVMVHVKAHSPELFQSWVKSPLYVRTSTLALFESAEVISPIRSGRWLYDIDDGKEDNAIILKSGTPENSLPCTLFISRDSVGHLPVPSNSTALFASAVYEFADDWYQLAPPEEIQKLRYTSLAPPLLPSSQYPLPGIERLRNQDAPGVYLSLPPSPLALKVTELTSGFDPKDPLQGIRDFLRKNTTYSLKFTTPDESSPVEEFLFGHGLGHCEHYAAATVLMLRSLGVPSRVVYGYAGGSADLGKQIIAFRDSDFHAWTEILTPDQNRWAIFDTTPNVPAAAPQAPGEISLPAMDESVYHDFSGFDPESVAPGRGFGEYLSEVIALISRHFLLTTAIGLGLLGGVWRMLSKRGRPDETSPAEWRNANGAAAFVPDFLREIENAGRVVGQTRRPGHTWREFLERIRAIHLPPDEVDAAIAYYYAVCYSGMDRDPAAEKEFLHQIRKWHDLLRPN